MPQRHHERAITAALVLSALVHLAVIVRIPQFRTPPEELTRSGPDELTVQLIPLPRGAPPAPPPVTARPSLPSPPPPPPPRARAPKPAPPPLTRPPVLASRDPSASPAPRTAPSATPAPAPPAADLASYIEARRRARSEPAPAEPAAPASAGENPNARANRLAAANIGAGAREMTFGFDPRRSGGVFSVQRMSYDYAEFMFFGWNRDVRRNLAQLVTVNKGGAPDIRVAVVQKMIAIIREYEQEDFVWESERLGRNVTLSARVRDTRGLEDFLLKEFFPEWRRP